MMLRLQKYLAEAGIASRRASEELITAGRVSVNGETATLGMSVDPDQDTVLFDGKPVKQEEELITLMLYKPKGVVSTSDDPQGRKTVQEYVKDIPVRLYNVGRLDINSEGLLLMTNDGELAHRLLSPKKHVDKAYFVRVDLLER
ncbi:MAG: rRNA pseudouridine synthase, partial [Clostridia bacterium]|nr:rRNA pseudouridine synthase [Clostridia bacterium]